MKNFIYPLTFLYKSPPNNIQLGRWSLKNCNTSHATSFYANRDHCGDIICKIPKKYDEQQYLEKKNRKRNNLFTYHKTSFYTHLSSQYPCHDYMTHI